MPRAMTEAERVSIQAHAVWLGGNGKRVRAWMARVLATEIGDLIRGRVWPYRPSPDRMFWRWTIVGLLVWAVVLAVVFG